MESRFFEIILKKYITHILNLTSMKKIHLDKGVLIMKEILKLDPSMTPVLAAGIAGNIMQESLLDPNAFYAAEGSYGYCQWRGVRLVNLRKFAGSTGDVDPKKQLEFIFKERPQDSFRTIERMLKMRDPNPSSAAHMFEKFYERSADSANPNYRNSKLSSSEIEKINARRRLGYQRRLDYAEDFYNAYIAKQTGVDFVKETGLPAGRIIGYGNTKGPYEDKNLSLGDMKEVVTIDSVAYRDLKIQGKKIPKILNLSKDDELVNVSVKLMQNTKQPSSGAVIIGSRLI